MQAYIALPIAALFFLELFWKRINAQVSLVTLVGDFSAGILRLILEINKSSFSGIWYSIADLNFFYFAIFSLLMCIALVKLVSLFTTTPVLGQLIGLTYRTTFENDRQVSLSSWDKKDLINSAVIINILTLILVYFSQLRIGLI